MTLEEKVRETIENMGNAEAVGMWNNYCEACNFCDDIIYNMSEFDELMEGRAPSEIARRCYYGDFCIAHDYFWFDGCGNLESCDFPIDESSLFSIDDVTAYIVENNDALQSDEIQEILDEDDEEDEEDNDDEDESE